MLKNRVVCVFGVVPLFLGGAAYGQVQGQESFRVSAKADARVVSNANLRAGAETDEGISELQTELGLLMLGRLQGRIADFQTDYSLVSRRYSEFPDRNEQQLLGESSLVVGTGDRQHYGRFSHSSREFLIDPGERDLPENRDSRTILSAAGYTSIRLGQPNALSLEVGASDFQFDQHTENEATRVSLGAGITRNVSPLSQVGVNLMGYHLNYHESDQDLEYRQVGVLWETALKWAEYSVEVGYNAMRRTGDVINSPLFRVNWVYQRAAQGFALSAAHILSDTTQGGGTSGDFDSAVGVDGRVQEIDQFKRTDIDFSWRHANPCDRCTVAVALGVQEESYFNFPEYSSREFDLGLRAGYQFSRAVALEFNLTARYFFAYRVEDSNDYRATRVNWALTFPELVRDGVFSVFVGAEERDYDIGAGYTSGFIGARFAYVLLSR